MSEHLEQIHAQIALQHAARKPPRSSPIPRAWDLQTWSWPRAQTTGHAPQKRSASVNDARQDSTFGIGRAVRGERHRYYRGRSKISRGEPIGRYRAGCEGVAGTGGDGVTRRRLCFCGDTHRSIGVISVSCAFSKIESVTVVVEVVYHGCIVSPAEIFVT